MIRTLFYSSQARAGLARIVDIPSNRAKYFFLDLFRVCHHCSKRQNTQEYRVILSQIQLHFLKEILSTQLTIIVCIALGGMSPNSIMKIFKNHKKGLVEEVEY